MRYILKEGVSLAGLQIEMRLAMRVAGKVYALQGKTYLKITSGTDGSHGIGSLHPYGLALDIELPPNPRSAVATIQREVGSAYDIILEKDHIHMEYDP